MPHSFVSGSRSPSSEPEMLYKINLQHVARIAVYVGTVVEDPADLGLVVPVAVVVLATAAGVLGHRGLFLSRCLLQALHHRSLLPLLRIVSSDHENSIAHQILFTTDCELHDDITEVWRTSRKFGAHRGLSQRSAINVGLEGVLLHGELLGLNLRIACVSVSVHTSSYLQCTT